LDPAVKAQRQLESIEKQIADLETKAAADKDAQLQLKHLHHQIGFLRQQIRDRVNAWHKTELARNAQRRWNGVVNRVIGVGFREAGSFVQSRITGAFDGIRALLPDLSDSQFKHVEGRGMRDASYKATLDELRNHRSGEHVLVAAATDSSALGVLDAARELGCEADLAIAGQDCIPEALEEIRTGKSALVGSVSHEVETYGPRLIQLGIALLRGNIIPPYNYVPHRGVTPESLAAEASIAANRQPALREHEIETESV